MEPEEGVSGTCIFRALFESLPVRHTLTVRYSTKIKDDTFYTKSERVLQFTEIIRNSALQNYLTPTLIEKAIEKELIKRDPTPPPKGHKKKANDVSANYDYFPHQCTHRSTPMNGTVTGRVFHNYMELFLTPKKFNDLLNHRVIAPIMSYNPQEQIVLFERIACAMAIGSKETDRKITAMELIHVFQHFLEIPDIKAILGNEFPVMDEHKWSLHLHMNCSKIDRIRNEIVVAQCDSDTPFFVSKFLDLVLQRVLEDHRNYETAYFDNRKMAIKDRMEHLPTSTKSRGKARPTLKFVNLINGSYEINSELVEKMYPFLNSWIQKSSEFQKLFLEYLEMMFPEKNQDVPCKSVLVFGEKFFRWAADTLEFEKTLTYSTRINYGFMERPLDHMIPLRVIHIPTNLLSPSLVFLDDIRHALRRYKGIYKNLQLDLDPPHLPGPIPQIHDYLELPQIEYEIRQLTKNHVFLDLQFGCIMGPYPELYPLPGPFNKHVVMADHVLQEIINTLMIDLRMCYQVDPTHPEVLAFVLSLKDYFPVRRNKYFIDLDLQLKLKREAFLLKKYKGSSIEVSIRSSDLETLAKNALLNIYPENGVNIEHMVAKTMFVSVFPQLAEIVHHHFCTSDYCYKSLLTDFTPTFGPRTEVQKERPPSVRCNAPYERYTIYTCLEEVLH